MRPELSDLVPLWDQIELAEVVCEFGLLNVIIVVIKRFKLKAVKQSSVEIQYDALRVQFKLTFVPVRFHLNASVGFSLLYFNSEISGRGRSWLGLGYDNLTDDDSKAILLCGTDDRLKLNDLLRSRLHYPNILKLYNLFSLPEACMAVPPQEIYHQRHLPIYRAAIWRVCVSFGGTPNSFRVYIGALFVRTRAGLIVGPLNQINQTTRVNCASVRAARLTKSPDKRIEIYLNFKVPVKLKHIEVSVSISVSREIKEDYLDSKLTVSLDSTLRNAIHPAIQI